MKKRDELLKLIATADYRGLSSLEKGLKLIADGHCGLIIAGELCSVSRSALQRGKRALAARRYPGINGRPTIFSHAEKENVVNVLHQEFQKGVIVDYEEGKRVVSLLLDKFKGESIAYILIFFFYSVNKSGLTLQIGI